MVYEKEQKLESILTKRAACRKASCTTSWLHAVLVASYLLGWTQAALRAAVRTRTLAAPAATDCTARCCVPGTVRCITRSGTGCTARLAACSEARCTTRVHNLAAWFAAVQANLAAMTAQLRTSFRTKLPSHARLLGPLRVRLALCSFGKKKSPRRWLHSELHRSLHGII